MEYCPIMKCSAIQDIAIVPVRISQTASSVRDESIRGITEKSRQFVCAFDTGATTSMISSRVAKELAFKMMDTKLVAVCDDNKLSNRCADWHGHYQEFRLFYLCPWRILLCLTSASQSSRHNPHISFTWLTTANCFRVKSIASLVNSLSPHERIQIIPPI